MFTMVCVIHNNNCSVNKTKTFRYYKMIFFSYFWLTNNVYTQRMNNA